MYEPITVVKVRKETKVTVPAGGWVLIGHPDEPLSAQIARRTALLKNGGVNDDFEKLLIGRIQSTHPNAGFVTKAVAAAAAKEKADREKNIAENIAATAEREEDAAETAAKAAAAAHAKKVKSINAENDLIRNRDANTKPVKAEIQLETSEAAESTENDPAGGAETELETDKK